MKTTKDWLLLGMGLALAALIAFEVVSRIPSHKAPLPGGVDGASLGRAYAPAVVSSLSDAWLAAADALGQGKSITEAEAVLQSTWKAGRTKAFDASVKPGFVKVLAEGSEPKDAAERAAVVSLWQAFARGLKGGR